MMRPRVASWRSDLIAWGQAMQGRPFVWGETDCVTLAREALRVCFGMDVVPHIPPWTSAVEAARVWAEHGPVSRVLGLLGATTHPLAFVRSGDVVTAPETEEPVGGTVVAVCLDGITGVLSNREQGVRLGDLRQLGADAVAYSLWAIEGTDG